VANFITFLEAILWAAIDSKAEEEEQQACVNGTKKLLSKNNHTPKHLSSQHDRPAHSFTTITQNDSIFSPSS